MTLNVDDMPTRKQYPVLADLEKALQEWQARNTLPTETVVTPTGGTLTTLKPRQPSGNYTNKPPSTSAILPKP